MKIKSGKDFSAGCIFLLLGVGFAWLAPRYSLGTPARMGAGFFPLVLGCVLVALGGIIALRSLAVAGDPLPDIAVRPLGKLVLAICLFAWLLVPVGLVGAVLVLVLVATSAGRNFKLKEAAALSIGLAAACAILFVKGLGLSVPLWPQSF